MNTAITQLQDLVLELVTDKHESVASIEDEVRLLLGNGVSRQQMHAAFEALRSLRYVDAFLYIEDEARFERYRRPRIKKGTAIWWLATDAGRRRQVATSPLS